MPPSRPRSPPSPTTPRSPPSAAGPSPLPGGARARTLARGRRSRPCLPRSKGPAAAAGEHGGRAQKAGRHPAPSRRRRQSKTSTAAPRWRDWLTEGAGAGPRGDRGRAAGASARSRRTQGSGSGGGSRRAPAPPPCAARREVRWLPAKAPGPPAAAPAPAPREVSAPLLRERGSSSAGKGRGLQRWPEPGVGKGPMLPLPAMRGSRQAKRWDAAPSPRLYSLPSSGPSGSSRAVGAGEGDAGIDGRAVSLAFPPFPIQGVHVEEKVVGPGRRGRLSKAP